MALRFDDKTGNLMDPIIDDTLKFRSITGEIVNAKPDETLLYEMDNMDTMLSLSNISVFIKNAITDRCNPREYANCIKCKKIQICVFIRHEARVIKTCTKCKYTWL